MGHNTLFFHSYMDFMARNVTEDKNSITFQIMIFSINFKMWNCSNVRPVPTVVQIN